MTGKGSKAASELIDQMMAARDQRRAQEASRAAARAAALARFEAEARAVAQARRELDDERLKRDAARKRLADEAIALENEKQRVEEVESRELEAREREAAEDRRLHEEATVERKRLDDEERARRLAREQLASEAARLEAEQMALAEAVALEAQREAALRATEQAMHAQYERDAAAKQAAVEMRRVELEQLDQRLEERATAERKSDAVPPPVLQGVRRKSRVQVSATVLVDSGGVVVALPLINASLTGGLIGREGQPFGNLRVGGMMLLTLVSNDDAKQQVDLVSRVVRIADDSIAVDWSQQDEESAHAVGRLLDDTSETPEEKAAHEQAAREEIDEIVDVLAEHEADQRADRGLPPLVETPPEVRRMPRLELAASLLVDHDGTQVQLALLNVSITGALVRTHETPLAKQRVGALLLLTLTASAAGSVVASAAESMGEHLPVDLMARIVRHQGDATAIDWSQDRAAELGVARLLEALARDESASATT